MSIAAGVVSASFTLVQGEVTVTVKAVDAYGVVAADGVEASLSLALGLAYSAVPFQSVTFSDGSTAGFAPYALVVDDGDGKLESQSSTSFLSEGQGSSSITLNFDYVFYEIPVTVGPAVATGLTIEGIGEEITEFGPFDLRALENYSDGSQADVTGDGSFSSSDNTVIDFADVSFPDRARIRKNNASTDVIFTRGADTHQKNRHGEYGF